MKKSTYDKAGRKLAAIILLEIAVLIPLILASIIGATPEMKSWGNNGNSQDSNAWSNEAANLNNLGRYNEALKAASNAIKLNPYNAHAWYTAAYSFNGLGKYNEAIKASDKALEIDPYSSDAWQQDARRQKEIALQNLGNQGLNDRITVTNQPGPEIDNKQKGEVSNTFVTKPDESNKDSTSIEKNIGVGVISGYIVKNLPTLEKYGKSILSHL